MPTTQRSRRLPGFRIPNSEFRIPKFPTGTLRAWCSTRRWCSSRIVRSDLRLQRAFDRLNLIFRETEDLYNRSVLTEPLSELRNLIACAYLIIKMARARRENVGLHYSLDLLK